MSDRMPDSQRPRAEDLSERQRKEIFNREFAPHIPDLYNFAYHLTKDRERTKDLVQETLMRAYQYIHYYTPGTNPKAWLLRILKNAFINEYRTQGRRPPHVPFEPYHVPEEPVAEETDTALSGEVARAFNNLPPDYRLIIYLADVMELKYEEIAAILDIPIGTVRSRLHRARRTLREALLDYARSIGYPVEEESETADSSTR